MFNSVLVLMVCLYAAHLVAQQLAVYVQRAMDNKAKKMVSVYSNQTNRDGIGLVKPTITIAAGPQAFTDGYKIYMSQEYLEMSGGSGIVEHEQTHIRLGHVQHMRSAGSYIGLMGVFLLLAIASVAPWVAAILAYPLYRVYEAEMQRMATRTELEADAGITTRKGRKRVRKLLRTALDTMPLKDYQVVQFHVRIKALTEAING